MGAKTNTVFSIALSSSVLLGSKPNANRLSRVNPKMVPLTIPVPPSLFKLFMSGCGTLESDIPTFSLARIRR